MRSLSGRSRAWAGLLIFLLLGMIPGCSQRMLTRGDARDALLKIPGLSLPDDHILIQKISQLDNRHAVVEADLTIAFQLERKGDRWVADQVRLDKGKWLKLEDLQQDPQEARRMRTLQDLNLLALALERYRSHQGSYPETARILPLANTLFPRFLPGMISRDAWDNDFIYQRENPLHYLLYSSGPDGKAGSKDDLRIEGGQLP